MKPYIFLLFLIVGLVLFPRPSFIAQQSAAQSRKAKTVEEFHEKARHLAELKKYREAIESYTAAIGLDARDPRAYVGRGDAKSGLENWREAIRDYDKAIGIYFSWGPEKPEEKVGDGTGNVTLQEFEAMQARPKAFDAARALGPTYFRRGLAKDELGDRFGACQDFREYSRWDRLDFKSFKICNKESAGPRPVELRKAQGQSVSSELEGTTWQAIHPGEIYSPLLGRSLTRQFFCSFGNHWKVSCRVFVTASSKMTYEPKHDPIRRRVELKPVRLPASTLSEENRVGTYKQNGNSIQIELPAYEIEAKVQGNSMEGNITLKLESSQRARWVAKRITGENSSSSQPIERPASPVSESEERQTTPETTGSSADLKLGTYTIRATQSFNSYGVTVEENIIVKLMIESMDRSGEVKARLSLGNQKGQLKGRVNEDGMLELKGLLTWSQTVAASKFTLESRFTLRATVGDSKLINGEYLMVSTSNSSETKGVFNSATWEKDF